MHNRPQRPDTAAAQEPTPAQQPAQRLRVRTNLRAGVNQTWQGLEFPSKPATWPTWAGALVEETGP